MQLHVVVSDVNGSDVTHVEKACACVTRDRSELLVFDGPGHDGLQIPKGTVEPGERPREAVARETVEESGLVAFGEPAHLATDVRTRRESPPRRYVRSFYHARVHEPRDRWTHVVTGDGSDHGAEYEFFWVDLPTSATFALDLDDYLHMLTGASEPSAGVTAD